MNAEEQERIMMARRMARMLARNRSHHRTVRKLPQAIVVIPKQIKRPSPLRRAINANKRLTYIVLLGATLSAFWYDVEVDTLEQMIHVVESGAESI